MLDLCAYECPTDRSDKTYRLLRRAGHVVVIVVDSLLLTSSSRLIPRWWRSLDLTYDVCFGGALGKWGSSFELLGFRWAMIQELNIGMLIIHTLIDVHMSRCCMVN